MLHSLYSNQTESMGTVVDLRTSGGDPIKIEDLRSCCKYLRGFCTAIGLFPLECVRSSCVTEFSESRSHCASFIGIGLILMLSAHVIVALQDIFRDNVFQNVADYAGKFLMFNFYATGFFVYLYHRRRHNRLLGIFRTWKRLRLHFMEADLHICRDVNLIAGTLIASAMLENAVNHLRYMNSVSSDYVGMFGYAPTNESFLQIYYRMNCFQWEKLVPYSPVMSLYVYVSEKLAWYGWNASDAILLVFSRAICFRFKSLYRQGKLVTSDPANRSDSTDKLPWAHIAQDHHVLWCYMSEMKEFFSPLIFVSIATSTYFMCMQLHFGLNLSSNVTFVDNVYAVWSVGHIWMRLFAICYAGSRVQKAAHKVGKLLSRCPLNAASLDVVRAEKYISWDQIGWTGMDFFDVTNHLLLKIISLIITYEVMILQASDEKNNGGSMNTAACQ